MAEKSNVRRSARAVALSIMLALASPVVTLAQNRQGRPNRPETTAKLSPVKLVVEADVTVLEDEIAGLMQFRGDMPADQAGRLELLIDLRVLSRWFFLASAAAKEDSDLQVAAYLRGDELRATVKALTEVFKDRPAPTPGQIDSMNRLHQLTFKLPELKSVKQGDELCRDVGVLLSVAGGPFPPEVKQIPFMRPPAPATRPTSGPASTVVDPQARLAALTVSAPLKRQIQTLAAAAAQPSAGDDAKAREESAAVSATLNKVLEMAEGLSRNTAVDPAARPKLEQQLSDAVALYADPRLRGPGQQRLAALDAYAGSVARIRKLNLRPELQQKLSPTLAWAANSAENGPKAMAAVEAFLTASARLDARFAGGQAPSQLPAREAKLLADTVKLAQQTREQFLTNASRAIPDAGTLKTEADAMMSSLDLADLVERLPKSQAALLAMKPKPAGSAERRILLALQALSEPKTTAAARDDATRTIATVQRLADLAAEGEAGGPVLSPDVLKFYAKNQLPALDARRRDVLSELASMFAAGKELDSQRLLRLQQIRQVRQLVQEAAYFEQAQSKAALAARWVDWAVQAEDLQTFVKAYRDGLSAIVEAYATDAASPPSLSALRENFGPFVKLIIRLNAPADASAGFPQGLVGNLGRLMTPLDVPAFSTERYGAFAYRLHARLEQGTNNEAAQKVVESLGRKLDQ